jgi:two-component system chemotaxis sensor kinase CheA
MWTIDETTPKTLRSLEMRLASFSIGDNDELAAIGVGLEEILSSLPEELPRPAALLMLCLEILQEVYMESVGDPPAAVQAARRAVGALERYFRSGKYASIEPLNIAGMTVWVALGRTPGDLPWANEVPEASWPVGTQRTLSVAPEAEIESVSLRLVTTKEPVAKPEPAVATPTSLLMAEDGIVQDFLEDGIVQDFLVESYENLDRLDLDLLALEKDPNDRETISSIFRTIHTIKGTCGFLGFSRLESLSHAGENLLSMLRTGELNLTPPCTHALLAMVDAIRQILGTIETTGNEGMADYTALTETLHQLQEQPDGEQTAAPKPTSTPALVAESIPPILAPVVSAESFTPIHGRMGDVLINQGYIQVGDLTRALREQEAGDQRRLGEILASMGLVTKDIVERATQAFEGTSSGAQGSVGDASIRVDVALLDSLMNLVGELVLTRNQIVQLIQAQGSQPDPAMITTAQRLNLITSELQEGVMKTRMQPIGNVWNKFPRVVRDLALSCGKQVRLEMEGHETDLDKTLIEAIKDPLTHLIRNSVDHGIERPDVRVASGKSAEGLLLLRAYHEGGQVNIEIQDDGGGIDTGRIKAKALERRFITSDQAARMSDREALQLIFLPGFSTAAAVTNVSGRGVGMDVVKTNIAKIGGTIDIQSQKKKGTTIKVKIPLTLAIVPALIVHSGEERYAIPQVSLLELVRLPSAQAGIERIHGIPVYRLRGKLLPLLFLDQELKQREEPDEDRVLNIVVLQANDQQFGLVVDSITDSEEIVVRPLSKHLKSAQLFAGATIMGDGRVALILDVTALAGCANLVADAHRSRGIVDAPEMSLSERIQTLLLFQIGRNGRMAIPLSAVARLEEFPRTLVEEVGRHTVVQYRGRIMPLLHLMNYVPGAESLSSELRHEPLQVIVIGEEATSVGMVVDSIVDIVEEAVNLEGQAPDVPVLGTMVIQGRVTQILDVPALLEVLQEENYGNATQVLHLLSGGVSLRGDTDSGARGSSSSADDESAAGFGDYRRADQSTGTDRHRNRPAKAAPPRRAA